MGGGEVVHGGAPRVVVVVECKAWAGGGKRQVERNAKRVGDMESGHGGGDEICGDGGGSGEDLPCASDAAKGGEGGGDGGGGEGDPRVIR